MPYKNPADAKARKASRRAEARRAPRESHKKAKVRFTPWPTIKPWERILGKDKP